MSYDIYEYTTNRRKFYGYCIIIRQGVHHLEEDFLTEKAARFSLKQTLKNYGFSEHEVL